MAGTFTNLLYHLIFSTKNRKPYIQPEFEEELFRYMGGIIRGEGGIALEINGTADHVHVLAKLKPTAALSLIMQRLKGNSSKWIRAQAKLSSLFGWQDGFSAFTVSQSGEPTVRRYIRNQKQHHDQKSFDEELSLLMKKHNIEFNERYLLG
jgi:REP element-mobilizing transposase RayT